MIKYADIDPEEVKLAIKRACIRKLIAKALIIIRQYLIDIENGERKEILIQANKIAKITYTFLALLIW